MSTSDRTIDGRNRSADRKLIGVFLFLLALAVVWPQPVIWLNRIGPGVPVSIDEESFLGREAPQWDVVFWWIAGLFGIWSAGWNRNDLRRGIAQLVSILRETPRSVLDELGRIGAPRLAGAFVATSGLLLIMAVWIDPMSLSVLTTIDQSRWWELTSFVNRAGGGTIPALTGAFIAIVGVTRARDGWVRLFVALAGASVVSALVLHTMKLVGRVRPELFLGSLDLQPGVGESFPSGHTLSAFVVAGGLAMVTRSRVARSCLIALACIVAMTRVITFRHWPSDVLFSAILGFGSIWLFVRSVIDSDETSGGARP